MRRKPKSKHIQEGVRLCRVVHPVVMILCLLGITPAVFAQQRINGKVVNKSTASPIVNATVTIESSLLSTNRTATTDNDGHFSFSSLNPGRYTLKVSPEGYYGEQVTLLLSPRATQQVDIELNPKASVKEEVTVTAKPKLLDESQAATIITLDPDQFLALPTARRTQLTDIITPYVASAVGSHDNLVHLRGNELSLNNFINGVSFLITHTSCSPLEFPRKSSSP